jgi:Histidine phosphatase superfamily (branch 2)
MKGLFHHLVHRWFCCCWLPVAAAIISTSHHSNNNNSTTENNFYQRYEAYPPYCSIPQEVEKRHIPKLQQHQQQHNSTNSSSSPPRLLPLPTLRHVTAVFRHGARTPWGGNLNCWDRYHTDPATAVWNCHLTAYAAAPPPPDVVAAQEGAATTTSTTTSTNTSSSSNDTTTMMWFEKRFDALQYPQFGLSNHLNGTCQLGQLIDQGYSQEIANGQFLRDAYAYYNNNSNNTTGGDGTSGSISSMNIDPTIGKLIDLNRPEPWRDQVYFRVDDEERTVLSGQLVLRGLFGETIGDTGTMVLHTADFDRDILDPNERICPRLVEITARNKASKGYQTLVADHEQVRAFIRDVLMPSNDGAEMDTIDCLMTTMCTDRPLPVAVNDYGRSTTEQVPNDDEWAAQYGTDRFQRLYEYGVQKYTYNLKANGAEYAKLGIGPLWYEIIQQWRSVMLVPAVADDNDNDNDHDRIPKLHIISGHDTTIMPLLAALDPNLWPDSEWPAYASLLVMELWHQPDPDDDTDDGSFQFRLVYNGRVLTMAGCTPNTDLCDVNLLLARLEDFAVPNPDCQRQQQVNATTPIANVTSTTTATTTTWSLVAAALLGAALGATVMYIVGSVVLGRCPGRITSTTTRTFHHHHRSNMATPVPSDDHDGIVRMTNGSNNSSSHHDDDDDNLL